MTINSPAAAIWAMYLAVAEKQGADWSTLSGTLQNDILKEYIAQKEYIYPPGPSMRLVTDTIEFGAERTPKFNPISISGYHIREAGSTAIQELAFTLRDGIEYVEDCLKRGMEVDDFAPRLSFFFNAHNDFFEEIAKYRAARRIWQRVMRERFGAKNPRSWALRFHAQTAGCSLTAQQPYNNVVRTAHPGAGRGAGRHAIAAHQFAGRSLGATDRSGGHHRAAHAADPRLRKRRDQYRRSLRRIVLRRDADHIPDASLNVLSRWPWIDKDVMESIALGEFDIYHLPKLHREHMLRNRHVKSIKESYNIPLDGSRPELITGRMKMHQAFRDLPIFLSAWLIYSSIRISFASERGPGLISWTERLIHKSLSRIFLVHHSKLYHRVLYQASKVCTRCMVYRRPRNDLRLLRIGSSKISAHSNPQQSSASWSKPTEERYCTYSGTDLSKLEQINPGLYYSG